MGNRENGMFKSTIESLFKGMDTFLSTKTVVGDPIHIEDTIILPLVDVTFGVGAGAYDKSSGNQGGGGMGCKLSPTAVLVITNGITRLIDVKNPSGINKILDMSPDIIDKIKGSNKSRSQKKADKAMEETVVDISQVEED